MPELLLEVGCEELPGRVCSQSLFGFAGKVIGMLSELFDATFDGVAFGTRAA